MCKIQSDSGSLVVGFRPDHQKSTQAAAVTCERKSFRNIDLRAVTFKSTHSKLYSCVDLLHIRQHFCGSGRIIWAPVMNCDTAGGFLSSWNSSISFLKSASNVCRALVTRQRNTARSTFVCLNLKQFIRAVIWPEVYRCSVFTSKPHKTKYVCCLVLVLSFYKRFFSFNTLNLFIQFKWFLKKYQHRT